VTKLAVIGLGAMGSRIAHRFLGTGHEVAVWNRTPEKMRPLVEAGAAAHDSPSDASKGADAVITMVADPGALREVSEGRTGILHGLAEGATLIEMSTVGPEAIERLAERIPTGRALIDAPVLGSTGEIDAGTLKIFVGGSSDDYERWKPLFSELGSPMHAGPLGSGATAKLVANLTLVATLTALGEALALADGLGLDRNTAFEVLSGTRLAAEAERRRDSVTNDEFLKRFALALARKDADLVIDAARRANIDLRVVPAAREWFAKAEEEGWGELDYSAVLAHILGREQPNG
jgi:3-hydroxyisobutyrate dehydrogenase/2-hydroxy-3-oxopropionate reductase